MKKMYKTPDLDVTLLEKQDIVTNSGEIPIIDPDEGGDFEVFGG